MPSPGESTPHWWLIVVFLLFGGRGGYYPTGEHPTLPTRYLFFALLCFRSEMVYDDGGHSTALHWRSVLSYIVREATAIEARAIPSIIDDMEGRV